MQKLKNRMRRIVRITKKRKKEKNAKKKREKKEMNARAHKSILMHRAMHHAHRVAYAICCRCITHVLRITMKTIIKKEKRKKEGKPSRDKPWW